MPNAMSQHISVSTETIVRVLAIAALALVAYEVRALLFLIFIAVILAAIMIPIANWAKRLYLPRGITVIFIYIIGAAIITGVGFALVPFVVDEVVAITQNFGPNWDRAITHLPPALGGYAKTAIQQSINTIAVDVQTGLVATIAGIAATVQGILGVFGSLIIILVLAFYMVVEEQALRKMVALFTPQQYDDLVARILTNIRVRLGGWARGQIVIALIVGATVYIALTVIGVPYALALASLATVLEFIPYLGPLISGITGTFFALSISWPIALITALVYFIISQIEGNILIPKIMQRATGINPVLSIISLLFCFELFGVIGAFIGMPIASLIIAIGEAVWEKNKK